jgi:hypothetical protein
VQSYEKSSEEQNKTRSFFLPRHRSAKQDAVSQQHQGATFAVTVADNTAVGSIKSNLKQHGVIYNVRGQKLPSPQKGINIIDRRKVIVK